MTGGVLLLTAANHLVHTSHMTTTKQYITPEAADDILWKTAVGNATGRIGAVIGNPWMLSAALKAVQQAERVQITSPFQDGTCILTIHGAGGPRLLYVRPDATPFDLYNDPWEK